MTADWVEVAVIGFVLFAVFFAFFSVMFDAVDESLQHVEFCDEPAHENITPPWASVSCGEIRRSLV